MTSYSNNSAKNPYGQDGPKLPLVSIILVTRNGIKTLPATLRSIQSQSYQETELILIDNHSSDGTKELLTNYAEVHESRGLSSQLNLGLSIAKGKYVLLLEQDHEMGPYLIDECVKLALSGYQAIVIPETREGSYWVRSRIIEVEIYNLAGDVSARFFNRNLLEKIEWFDKNLSGLRDYDFAYKMQSVTNAYGQTKESISSHSDDNLTDYVRKFYSRGYAAAIVAKRHGTATILAPYIYLLTHPFVVFRRPYAKYIFGFCLVKLVELQSVVVSLVSHMHANR
ncbi:MAG: glycosyltransferase family 2 protein [Nitrososphaerota archaeon]|nr:glycosyltransferase family 2 protein [Nitrososphaerota archaeon]